MDLSRGARQLHGKGLDAYPKTRHAELDKLLHDKEPHTTRFVTFSSATP